ncbi:uncharacterized protein SCHCODRAFT_02356428 [Schizophyllum commune H4-8]|uniref:uncharacterized protein n=1 Tax=Schizophyllum commune (strain H4-8 / FGSC 9210) TaxID=578458 RepID=UPI00215FA295|nr:uncharacterized protein SCHCODRAFT_02356428 [Schizophyllum commune H4-8]KAI5888965.1 hypothetical protein SCHCODRAFT_02356428 [Schizophyllum commune H4-8]
MRRRAFADASTSLPSSLWRDLRSSDASFAARTQDIKRDTLEACARRSRRVRDARGGCDTLGACAIGSRRVRYAQGVCDTLGAGAVRSRRVRYARGGCDTQEACAIRKRRSSNASVAVRTQASRGRKHQEGALEGSGWVACSLGGGYDTLGARAYARGMRDAVEGCAMQSRDAHDIVLLMSVEKDVRDENGPRPQTDLRARRLQPWSNFSVLP